MAQREKGLALGDAARALGVSVDTLRRWDRAGKLRTERDDRNRRRVPAAEVERLSRSPRRRIEKRGAIVSAGGAAGGGCGCPAAPPCEGCDPGGVPRDGDPDSDPG